MKQGKRSSASGSLSAIASIRKKIDAMDDEILRLLESRAKLAQAIGEEKRRAIEDGTSAPGFYDPEREQMILERLKSKGGPTFPPASIPFVFREIMSACRSLEASVKVAYLGPPGTYTQIAAHQTFGKSAQYVESPTIDGVFDAVTRGEAEYGIVPIENSAAGGVIQTMDALLKTDLTIRNEAYCRIDHCLVGQGSSLEGIHRVYSHPQALIQCRNWLAQNLPHAELISSKSTAAAAHTAKGEKNTAAIASRLTAELLGLHLLREGIQDQNDNATRFIVLSRSVAPKTGKDRTTAVLYCKDNRSLLSVLKAFERAKIPVSRIESKASSEKMWNYLYFIDFQGHCADPKVARVLKQAARSVDRIKFLGSYPQASL